MHLFDENGRSSRLQEPPLEFEVGDKLDVPISRLYKDIGPGIQDTGPIS